MGTALRPRYTVREYTELEAASIRVKHEYVSGEIYAMAGGSTEHTALTNVLAMLIGGHLRGQPCRTYSSDLQITIEAADVYTYADLTVLCDLVERAASAPGHVINPLIVVEVLSPSTERYDREQKRLHYQQLASLQEYVLVAQDRKFVEVWRKAGDTWQDESFEAESHARLTSIDDERSVDEVSAEAGFDRWGCFRGKPPGGHSTSVVLQLSPHCGTEVVSTMVGLSMICQGAKRATKRWGP